MMDSRRPSRSAFALPERGEEHSKNSPTASLKVTHFDATLELVIPNKDGLNTLYHVHENSGEIPAGTGGVLSYPWTVGIVTLIPRTVFKKKEEF